MKLLMEPAIINRVLKLGSNYVGIQKAKEEGFVDILTQYNECDTQQRTVIIKYRCPYIECSPDFLLFTMC